MPNLHEFEEEEKKHSIQSNCKTHSNPLGTLKNYFT